MIKKVERTQYDTFIYHRHITQKEYDVECQFVVDRKQEEIERQLSAVYINVSERKRENLHLRTVNWLEQALNISELVHVRPKED